MAPRKSTKSAAKAAEEAVKTPAPMTEENQTVEKEADVVVETKAETAEEPKKEKKTPGRKPSAAKKETAKKEPAAKTAAEKAPAAKPGRKPKKEIKAAIHLQFAGKSYTEEDLMKIARDVWKYDLKQKVGDLDSVELYVKPEENTVYYVMNKDFMGSFQI
ncbi:MAG: DNA-binding protein [Acetatifactor sp.]|nr:DNA-binding protein [Acetatifactor sp.]